MAKEKFLIVAVRMPDDCFGRFSESENRDAIDNGEADSDDAYSWVEASFEIQLRRYREATHICSFTPSARYTWLQNAFVGVPNAAWDYDGDPEGLENESGGEWHGYGDYHDEYDSRLVCDTFTIDTVRDLGLRKPSSRDKLEAYHDAIWKAAEETAIEISHNGLWCDGLNVFTFRQMERDSLNRIRADSLALSRRAATHVPPEAVLFYLAPGL